MASYTYDSKPSGSYDLDAEPAGEGLGFDSAVFDTGIFDALVITLDSKPSAGSYTFDTEPS